MRSRCCRRTPVSTPPDERALGRDPPWTQPGRLGDLTLLCSSTSSCRSTRCQNAGAIDQLERRSAGDDLAGAVEAASDSSDRCTDVSNGTAAEGQTSDKYSFRIGRRDSPILRIRRDLSTGRDGRVELVARVTAQRSTFSSDASGADSVVVGCWACPIETTAATSARQRAPTCNHTSTHQF